MGPQRAGTHMPGADVPRSLVPSSGFGQGTLFRRNIIEQGTDQTLKLRTRNVF